MGKQAWRYKAFGENTQLIEEFCAEHNLSIEYLNNGYQLRINGVIDLYPVRQKWHYLKTDQRGTWESLDDLDMSIFEMVNHDGTYMKGVINADKPAPLMEVRVPEHPLPKAIRRLLNRLKGKK